MLAMHQPRTKANGYTTEKIEERTKGGENNENRNVIKKSLVGGRHQLTDKQIDAFQRYYGKGIRDSIGTDVLTMRLKVMSGFWHAISRNGEGNHHHIH